MDQQRTVPLQAVCQRCDDGYIYTTEDGYEFVQLCECRQGPRRAPRPAPSWVGELAGRVTALNEALAVGDWWLASDIGLALEEDLVCAQALIEDAAVVPVRAA